MGSEVFGCMQQERSAGGTLFVGQDLGIGKARVIVDQRVHVVVADRRLVQTRRVVGRCASIAAPAATVANAAELLDLHMDQLAGSAPLVPAAGFPSCTD